MKEETKKLRMRLSIGRGASQEDHLELTPADVGFASWEEALNEENASDLQREIDRLTSDWAQNFVEFYGSLED